MRAVNRQPWFPRGRLVETGKTHILFENQFETFQCFRHLEPDLCPPENFATHISKTSETRNLKLHIFKQVLIQPYQNLYMQNQHGYSKIQRFSNFSFFFVISTLALASPEIGPQNLLQPLELRI